MKGRSVLFSKICQQHLTPPDFFEQLNCAFEFRLDPAANPTNNLGLERFYTKSGITNDWDVSAFCNPPYDNVDLWVSKVIREGIKYPKNDYVILLPSRTDRPWFTRLFETATAICFINRRMRFWEMSEDQKETKPEKNVAPFPSLLAVYSHGPHYLTNKQCDTLDILGNVIYFRRTAPSPDNHIPLSNTVLT